MTNKPTQPIDEVPSTLTCFKCHETKPIEEFKKRADRKYGREKLCMPCFKSYLRDWYKRTWEKREAVHRKYLSTEEGRRKSNVAHAKYHKTTPEKVSARVAVRDAIKKGTLIRPNACDKCLRPCKPQAHHPDYAKKLDVMWLCTVCHTEIHGWLAVKERKFNHQVIANELSKLEKAE